MNFSIRHLLMFVTAIAAGMTLASKAEPGFVVLGTFGIGAVVTFCLPMKRRRPFFYGGILGIALAFVVSGLVFWLLYIRVPRERILYVSNAGEMSAPDVQRETQRLVGPYLIPLGFVIGSTMGLAYSRERSEKNQNDF